MYALFAHYSASHNLPVLCPFRRLTGLRCPLCGFTTATASMLRGDLRSATRAHWLAPILLSGALFWYGWEAARLAHQGVSRLVEETTWYGD